ncbi:YbhB/YbcL family Raf kinase inhibitor-like protein [Colwellia sp. M166]|uniref:YbhB/YbcL family Raf kinase inhibitor-like protein n=1 Tax=Colwellia sp. M166 TaxID=2583805 RepID=UPI00211DC416|nr:YbhB/YbcL family Raf kinase inhibitor-like protein [Colwellia sp. M166]UUO21961.1 YbhB/YbcL family Raf kinase inhibitor-like protein [Colwellia sp. M166]|tara:strand:+ start:6180 stop:6965 length:786 start_codon:yes stop_codon:yes gene_type:complete
MKIKNIASLIPIVSIASLILLMSTAAKADTALKLFSPAFLDNQVLPVQFTCEGDGISPPLNWQGVPDDAKSLVLIMDHMPIDHRPNKNPPPLRHKEAKTKKPEGLRWYWSVYNIPASVSGIASGANVDVSSNKENEQPVGTFGSNVVNDNNEYAPPCSKGPGLKNYTFHLYALSKMLVLPDSKHVSAETLRASMHGVVLASDALTVSFERSCQSRAKPRLEQGSQQDNQQEEKRHPPSTLPLCEQAKSTTDEDAHASASQR